MKIYCISCKGQTETKSPKAKLSANGRRMAVGECVNCGTRKSKFLAGSTKQKQMKGEGIVSTVKSAVSTIFNRIKNFITGRKPGSPELMSFIQKHGNESIKQLTVCRVPVSGAISTALNIITLGAFDKVTKDLSYDKLFHLFLVIKTDNGSYITERNEIVRAYNGSANGDQMPIPVRSPVNISEFFYRAIKSQGDGIFVYDAFKNNCQDYILRLLNSNGLLTQPAMTFIKQDLTELLKRIPGYVPAFAKRLTDFASRLRILQGKGKRKTIKRLK